MSTRMTSLPEGVRVPEFACCGVRITAAGPTQARDLLLLAHHGRSRAVHLCNAYTLSLAMRSEDYRALLNKDDFRFADGHHVAAVGRRRGHAQMCARVYGPNLMLETIDQGRQRGLRHFLYGGAEGVADALADRLVQRFPGAQIVGVETPPFRQLSVEEEEGIRLRINSTQPDVVWVGLGTPRQDEFVARQRGRVNATMVAVGAAFDFLSGTKPQAPQWMQAHGLEWSFRLATEPRRLWKRYLVGNTLFLLGLARDNVQRTGGVGRQ